MEDDEEVETTVGGCKSTHDRVTKNNPVTAKNTIYAMRDRCENFRGRSLQRLSDLKSDRSIAMLSGDDGVSSNPVTCVRLRNYSIFNYDGQITCWDSIEIFSKSRSTIQSLS